MPPEGDPPARIRRLNARPQIEHRVMLEIEISGIADPRVGRGVVRGRGAGEGRESAPHFPGVLYVRHGFECRREGQPSAVEVRYHAVLVVAGILQNFVWDVSRAEAQL